MAQTKANNHHVGFVEMIFNVADATLPKQHRTYKLGKKYKVFVADTEEKLMMSITNYCQKFGIVEAKAISKEEFEDQMKEVNKNESNSQISL